MSVLSGLGAQDVPVFETFVVPRYLSTFGAAVVQTLIPSEGAVIAHVGCRTGFPDQQLARVIPGAAIVGFDPSEPALELARTKSTLIREARFDYRLADEWPLAVPDASFSHAMQLHPMCDAAGYAEILREMYRLLAPAGQAVIALPLRGSFLEVTDLLREFALKHDVAELTSALETHATARHTVETLSEELESCGFDDVDIDMRLMTLSFHSGRGFLEDPITRMVIVPDLELWLGVGSLGKPMDYVGEAIDRYWSEGEFELSVNIGCASARKY